MRAGADRASGADPGPARLDPAAVERYSRQLVLREVGERGQLRLRAASVAIVGCGALGSPAALYLAAAGVGRLTLIDDDAVSLDNLPRQPLHDEGALGAGKAQSAARRLSLLNGAVQCRALRRRLVPDNAGALLAGHDCIVDGSDNFPTKFLVNDVALALGVPAVIGGVLAFRGQVLVVAPGGPCYRCLFGEPPPVGRVGSCRTAGVLGALAGIIGSLQAMEALKLLLGIGRPLAGRVQEYEALSGRWRQVPFPRAAGCPACGGHSR